MNGQALPSDLLGLPVRRASRLVALSLLERAVEAHPRLGDPEDAEALHDLRVALRRLRSWLRAFRPWLAESVSPKMRRRLRNLANATGTSRDAEVHLAWIAAQREQLTPRQRAGARWLEQRLLQTKAKSDAELHARVASRFARIRDTLQRSLGEYTTRVHLDERELEPRFAAIMASLLRDHAAELHEHLGRFRAYADEEEGHRARIVGKHLRYLIEPLVQYFPEAEQLVERLKQLQDALGDVHDAHVFAGELTSALQESAAEQARLLSHSVLAASDDGAELRRGRSRDPRHGLVALARLLRERGEQAFATVEREWLGEAAAPFFAAVEALASRLDAWEGAGVEIERKYLLSELPAHAVTGDYADIRQGYLPGTRLIERLRHVSTSNGERWIRTVKSGSGLVRLELEEEAPPELFRKMWPLTKGRRLAKRRWTIREGDRTWEIDQFTDRELVLVEVELPDADAAVELPEWLATYVVREVTGEAEYVNVNLAR